MNRLGQHFLKNKTALKNIAEALEIRSGENIIEIGPGHGELTSELLARGANVIAVEKDDSLAEALEKNFAGDNFSLVKGDALKKLGVISAELGEYKLCGNIPYYITGRLMRIVGEAEHRPRLCVFTVQKEVGERMREKPPRMNRLAASVQFWAEPEIFMNISRGDFSPEPGVDSVGIKLRAKDTENDAGYFAAMRALFAQPRKTVLNNLSAALGKEAALFALRSAGLDGGLRPQNLEIEDIAKLSKAF